jgi:hypothetical protein
MAEPKTRGGSFDVGEGKPEYLLGRSRGQRPFRRGAITFTATWNAWRLDELGPDRVRLILSEPAVQAQLATREQAQEILTTQEPTAEKPKTELEILRSEVSRQRGEIEALKVRLVGAVEKGKLTPP